MASKLSEAPSWIWAVVGSMAMEIRRLDSETTSSDAWLLTRLPAVAVMIVVLP